MTQFEPDRAVTKVTRGRVAKPLVELIVKQLPVTLRYPDGHTIGAGGPDAPVLELIRPDVFFRRLESHPKIGLGEAYMAGDWRVSASTDLADALKPFAQRISTILPRPLLALRALVDRAIPEKQRNDIRGSRANIEAHYDLSNDLFATFLDPSMTYSSALFSADSDFDSQDLLAAQHRKIDAALDAAGVTAGCRLLEIGTGWGELALRAAQRGAEVTSITLSARQLEYAVAKIEAAGLADRVKIELRDYREVEGTFDAVVSIEMIEAVGEEYWPTYFSAIDRALAPHGTAVIQAILMDHDRLLATRNSYGWIQKYIFPGGLIPSLQAIGDVLAEHSTMRAVDVNLFGQHYAHTLKRWRATFMDAREEVKALGFDETFQRMWEFYLAYCEAGFAVGYLDVGQVKITKD